MTRQITNLRWAYECQPAHLPCRPRDPKKAAGIRYENRLAAALPNWRHSIWFRFEDASGLGYCQPDIFLANPHYSVVLEAKLSLTTQAWNQLEGLYIPVLERALRRPAFGVVVARNLRAVEGEVCSTLDEAITLALCRHRAVLHWMGVPAQLWRKEKVA